MREYKNMRLFEKPEEVKKILIDNNKIMELDIHPIVKELLLNADKNKLMQNVDLHMKKIADHSFYVGEFCKQAGIPQRGEEHDLSKWSADELFESIYFYEGTRSPIDKANEVIGWSPAFLHHTQCNDHQLENSIYLNCGMIKPVEKTLDAAIEVVCDFCGAAKAYMGEKFTFQGELDWWHNRLKTLNEAGTIHPKMAEFITIALEQCLGKDAMIGYKDFENIWKEIHQEKEIVTEESFLEEVKINVADDVLNNDMCTTKPDTIVDNFFITEDEIGDECL